MLYSKTRLLEGIHFKPMANFLILSSVATFLPFVIHFQWVTGPIVNMILIVTLFLVGLRSALVLCLIPSLMALSGGLLPAVLAPVVPFIMISNVILVLSIDWFYNNSKSQLNGYLGGVIIGAGLKFIFLFLSIDFISRLLINQGLVAKVAQMMSWPQFATAVTGGLLAWVILKWLKRI